MDQESTATPPDDVFNLKRLCRYFSELSPQPMLAVEGAAFIVRHVNDAFLSMAGAQRDDVLGHPFAEAVPEGEANGCMALLDRVYRTGKPEFLAEQKHGNATAARWSYAVWAILGNDDRPAGVMIQVTDSTETANFREQAAMMNESLLLNSILQQQLRT
jgi:PAS domain S-box-containing protein